MLYPLFLERAQRLDVVRQQFRQEKYRSLVLPKIQFLLVQKNKRRYLFLTKFCYTGDVVYIF